MTFWPCFYKFSVEVFQNKELRRKTIVVHRSSVVMNFKISKKLVTQLSHSTSIY